MNISKFKLLGSGLDGVTIEAIEKMPHENMMFLDQVTRTRKVPLSDELRDKIQNLKYFFLNLTSHWISPYNNYFDLSEYKLLPLVEKDGKTPQGQTLLHDIWNHTRITGVTLKNAGFVITGDIEVVEGKKIGLATPFITEQDDLAFYVNAVNKIEEIMLDLAQAIETRALPMPKDKQMMISFGENAEEVEAMSIEEIEKKVVNRLIDRGAIIMMDDSMMNDQKAIDDGQDKATLHTGTNSIDSHKMPEAEEHKDEKTEEKEKTTKKSTKKKDSTLVSDAKFNVDLNDEIPKVVSGKVNDEVEPGGTLEHLEYSENMGMTDQKDEVDDKKSEW